MLHSHEDYMGRCIELALRGSGNVSPNPMVGCVIVHGGNIISEGWHTRAGEAHAERDAILKIEGDSRLLQSTLYVNLEPCAHFGKTPPCANFIVQHKIPEVVYGCGDPFAEVNGKGLQFLTKNNVKIIGPVLEKENRFLNRRFFTFHEKKRPYVILKWAESADGFMATENKERMQISGHSARVLLHKWRAEEAAVLVGSGTVVADNPKLDVRYWNGKNPLRVIFNSQLKGNLVSENKTIIFNALKTGIEENAEFVKVANDNFIPTALELLYERGIQSIIVEGGAETISGFLKMEMYDEIRVIESKSVEITKGILAPKVELKPNETLELDEDVIEFIYK